MGHTRQLWLATTAFAVCFAVWGLISGLMPLLKSQLALTQTQAMTLVALPVLLGSLGRIPAGMLTDRYGGRTVFAVLLAFCCVPAIGLSLNHSWTGLCVWGLLLGAAGTSFAVGVGFVSKHFPAKRQGTALGFYGTGNIGQSVAVFAGPVLAQRFGIAAVFAGFGAVALVWAAVFWCFARDAIGWRGQPRPWRASLDLLRTEPRAWLLGLFYFVTFGGFVALGVTLPMLLRTLFDLSPTQAGLRAALFVLLATAARPLGGWLSDRFGAKRVLAVVFGVMIGCALALAQTVLEVFTTGYVLGAVALGLGNGAVFKLVAQYFPNATGTVTGLVGALGGLGGFFPPLLLGVVKDQTGSFALGFVLLAITCVVCLAGLGWTRPPRTLSPEETVPA